MNVHDSERMAGLLEQAGYEPTADDLDADVVLINTARPGPEILAKYEREHKHPLERGEMPEGTDVVEGAFWSTDIARHDRRRLSYAVWAVISQRLLC